MLNRRQFNKLLLASVLAPSFGCNIRKDKFLPDILRLNLGFEPESLDWSLASDQYSFDVIVNLMAGLTKYDENLQSVPSIAKRWDVSPDGKTYTFYLDEFAKWTDGKPVTADDFVYSWTRILDPKTAGPYAFLLHCVKNAYGFNKGEIEDSSLLGAKALDDRTFQVELESPIAFFINLTSYCFSFPQRKDIIEKHGSSWTEPENIVTCGPFKLDAWKHEYKMSLIANPYYKNPRPSLKEIKYFIVPEQSSGFALYKNDELDFIDSRSVPVSEIETTKRMIDTRFQPLLRGTYVGFNVHKPPFDNPLVRRAFGHAVDRNIFPKILGKDEVPTTTWIPPGLPDFYQPDIGLKYNVKKARELLAEAGFPNGKGFPKIKMLFPTQEVVKIYCEAIQSFWKKTLNVEVELINEEWKVYLATLRQDAPHIYRLSWGADYPDPDTFMNLFTTNSGKNMGRFDNKKYNDLIAKGATTLDLKKRQDYYEKAQKILLEEEAAIVPLFFNTQVYLQKPWVNNIALNAMDVVFCEKISVS